MFLTAGRGSTFINKIPFPSDCEILQICTCVCKRNNVVEDCFAQISSICVLLTRTAQVVRTFKLLSEWDANWSIHLILNINDEWCVSARRLCWLGIICRIGWWEISNSNFLCRLLMSWLAAVHLYKYMYRFRLPGAVRSLSRRQFRRKFEAIRRLLLRILRKIFAFKLYQDDWLSAITKLFIVHNC